MKKYIMIILKGKKEPIHLSIEKWTSILEDEKNLVAYTLDSETEWNGKVLNKLDVSWSDYDREYSEKTNEPKYVLYRRKSDNVMVKLLEGSLLDDVDNYEKI